MDDVRPMGRAESESDGAGESKGPEMGSITIERCKAQIREMSARCIDAPALEAVQLRGKIVQWWTYIVGEDDTTDNQRKLAQAKEALAQAEKALAQAVLDNPDATDAEKAIALGDKRAAQAQLVLLLELQREQARQGAAEAEAVAEARKRGAGAVGGQSGSSPSKMSRSTEHPSYAHEWGLAALQQTPVLFASVFGDADVTGAYNDLRAHLDELQGIDGETGLQAWANKRLVCRQPNNLTLIDTSRSAPPATAPLRPDLALHRGDGATAHNMAALVELKPPSTFQKLTCAEHQGQVMLAAKRVLRYPLRHSVAYCLTNFQHARFYKFAVRGDELQCETFDISGWDDTVPLILKFLHAPLERFELPPTSIGGEAIVADLGRGASAFVVELANGNFAKLHWSRQSAEHELTMLQRIQRSAEEDHIKALFVQSVGELVEVEGAFALLGAPVCKRLESADVLTPQQWGELVSALEAMKRLRIVHRDLRPENFCFVDEGERLRVLDFGFAVVVPDDTETYCGPYCGTLRYASFAVQRQLAIGVGPITVSWRDDLESVILSWVSTRLSQRWAQSVHKVQKTDATAMQQAWLGALGDPLWRRCGVADALNVVRTANCESAYAEVRKLFCPPDLAGEQMAE